ncbi:MAG: 30S ribosomal protein S16 [Gammaproteobacteria bacterium]
MVVIRLSKSGAKKAPYYFITVADIRKPRDGRFIERIGFFNPVAKGKEDILRLDNNRFEYWVGQGAQVTERVQQLQKDSLLSNEELVSKVNKKLEKRKAKKDKANNLKIQELKAAEQVAAKAAAAEEEAVVQEEAVAVVQEEAVAVVEEDSVAVLEEEAVPAVEEVTQADETSSDDEKK